MSSRPTSRTRSSTGSCVTHDGAIRHEPTRAAIEGEAHLMSEAVVWLTIFILSVFVGIEVISKVSSTLHTPLMSGANAIHGVILLGAIIVTGSTDNNLALVVGLIAIVLAAVNMVGGFVVTDRMLQMFVRKKPAAASRPSSEGADAVIPTWAQLLYLFGAVCFILALKGLSGPKTARNGNLIGAFAAVLACAIPFFYSRPRPRAADPGGDRGRHGRRRLRRPHRADDPDAADGGAVQRRRRRRGGAGGAARAARDRRVRRRHRELHPGRDRRSRSWSARCPSPARSSPSPSSRT